MEEMKKDMAAGNAEKDIVLSKTIKAGKRIYYLDVKEDRRGEMFLSITESKKIVSGEGENAKVSFEKHKIFLHKEDFEKFADGLHEMIQYIYDEQGPAVAKGHHENTDTFAPVEDDSNDNEIKIDIDF